MRGPPSPDGVVGLVSYVDALNVGGGGDRPEVTPASVVPTCDKDLIQSIVFFFINDNSALSVDVTNI